MGPFLAVVCPLSAFLPSFPRSWFFSVLFLFCLLNIFHLRNSSTFQVWFCCCLFCMRLFMPPLLLCLGSLALFPLPSACLPFFPLSPPRCPRAARCVSAATSPLMISFLGGLLQPASPALIFCAFGGNFWGFCMRCRGIGHYQAQWHFAAWLSPSYSLLDLVPRQATLRR